MVSEELKILLMIGLGGALGSISRFLVQEHIGTHDFPWGTFVVNFLGSLLIAMIFFSSLGSELPNQAKAFIFIGLFGGFTTMSSFSLDTVGLIIAERFGAAFLNVALNGGLCVIGALTGRAIVTGLV